MYMIAYHHKGTCFDWGTGTLAVISQCPHNIAMASNKNNISALN